MSPFWINVLLVTLPAVVAIWEAKKESKSEEVPVIKNNNVAKFQNRKFNHKYFWTITFFCIATIVVGTFYAISSEKGIQTARDMAAVAQKDTKKLYADVDSLKFVNRQIILKTDTVIEAIQAQLQKKHLMIDTSLNVVPLLQSNITNQIGFVALNGGIANNFRFDNNVIQTYILPADTSKKRNKRPK